MKETAPEFSYIVDSRLIPATGLTLDLRADEKQRQGLADRFGLPAVDSLSAHAVLKRAGRDRIRVSADFKAMVTQICVVTLEPFPQTVEDGFTVVFSQGEDPSLKLNEIDLNAQEEEEIEFSENGKIDVGELIAEYLSLALDPFPHAPGAVFKAETAVEEKKNAFSVLENLKFK